jgi:hypothetical protein
MLGKLSTVFLAILLSAPWTIGQSTFGDILGVVKDPSQGTVLAAQVVLTRVEDKSEHSATTDADGAFHFVNLRPGHYDLLVSAPGFLFGIEGARNSFDLTSNSANAQEKLPVLFGLGHHLRPFSGLADPKTIPPRRMEQRFECSRCNRASGFAEARVDLPIS